MKKMAGPSTGLRTGQSTLELTVALILVSMLVIAALKIFLWMNERMVLRQQLYEANRVAAGNMVQDASANLTDADLTDREKIRGGYQVDESALPAFNIFN